MRSVTILFFLLVSNMVHGQTITTIAGDGTYEDHGDGNPSNVSRIKSPTSITTDSLGNVYITDFWTSCIRKLDIYGYISTVAGTHISGHSGDSGLATAAKLSYPMAVKADRKGNLYILDDQLTFGPMSTYTFTGTYVRKVDAAGIITTIAGNGLPGTGGDGGPALDAYFNFSMDLAVDPVGNVYIAGDGVIRKIDTAGIINIFAGTDSAGFSGDSGLAVMAQISYPSAVATDRKGNVYISDDGNGRIRKVDTAGIITTVAGSGIGPFSAPPNNGTPAITATIAPFKLTVDDTGNIYFDDVRAYISKIDTAGIITTIAGDGMTGYTGDGGPATDAQIGDPYGIAIDDSGNIFFPDWDHNYIREIFTAEPLAVSSATVPLPTLRVWPEPNNGIFNAAITAPTTLAATIIITDISGQAVKTINTLTNKTNTIDLNAAAGTYCVTAIAGGQSQSTVMIVQ